MKKLKLDVGSLAVESFPIEKAEKQGTVRGFESTLFILDHTCWDCQKIEYSVPMWTCGATYCGTCPSTVTTSEVTQHGGYTCP